jgi:hypothetical protein
VTFEGFDVVRLGEVRGWLRSFAALNTALGLSDQWFEYSLEDVPWRGELTESLQAHFDSGRRKGGSWRLTLTEASPWRDEFEKVVERWFFGFDSGLGERFAAARANRRLTHEQEPVSAFSLSVSDFIAGRDVLMWKIELEGPGEFDFYAVMHENVVLQVATATLLHFDFQSND